MLFVIGMFVGLFLGIIIMACLTAAKYDDIQNGRQ